MATVMATVPYPCEYEIKSYFPVFLTTHKTDRFLFDPHRAICSYLRTKPLSKSFFNFCIQFLYSNFPSFYRFVCITSLEVEPQVSLHIRIFSGPYFPAFGLNTERCEVSPRIQSECGKIRTRKTANTDTFHAVFDSIQIRLKNSLVNLETRPTRKTSLFFKSKIYYK